MSDHTKVGELRSGGEPRDAIHIAVAPVIASVALNPGEHIGFTGEDTETVGPCEKAMALGVVDPFLTGRVRPGDRFWMFLYPNTITSLRHNWTHPAFGEGTGSVMSEASDKWLRDYFDRVDGPSYEDFMAAVRGNGVYEAGDGYSGIHIGGGYITVSGSDAHGEVPDEFWDHVEAAVGRKLPEYHSSTSFSCSC